jgi:hypothetical protein
MSITLEWVVLPNGIYLRTICKNGVPLPDPTRYLLSYVYPDHGSTQTIRTYAQYLLPFYKWLDRQGLILSRICGRGKASDILFQKEGKDHAKGSKDLYTRV